MSLPTRNSCFVPLLKGCSEPGVGYIAASLPSAAHQSTRTLPTRLRANVLARKATKVVNLSRCGVSFRSREERTMDRKKTFWFLSLFLISLMGSSVTATAAVHQGSFVVGHSVRRLNVPGTLGENRPVDVHLWYPARNPEDCDNSDNSDGNRDDQGCSVTPRSTRHA